MCEYVSRASHRRCRRADGFALLFSPCCFAFARRARICISPFVLDRPYLCLRLEPASLETLRLSLDLDLAFLARLLARKRSPNPYPRHEIFLSDGHTDYINAETIEDHAPVVLFDEEAMLVPCIGSTEYFFRSQVVKRGSKKKMRIEVSESDCSRTLSFFVANVSRTLSFPDVDDIRSPCRLLQPAVTDDSSPRSTTPLKS